MQCFSFSSPWSARVGRSERGQWDCGKSGLLRGLLHCVCVCVCVCTCICIACADADALHQCGAARRGGLALSSLPMSVETPHSSDDLNGLFSPLALFLFLGMGFLSKWRKIDKRQGVESVLPLSSVRMSCQVICVICISCITGLQHASSSPCSVVQCNGCMIGCMTVHIAHRRRSPSFAFGDAGTPFFVPPPDDDDGGRRAGCAGDDERDWLNKVGAAAALCDCAAAPCLFAPAFSTITTTIWCSDPACPCDGGTTTRAPRTTTPALVVVVIVIKFIIAAVGLGHAAAAVGVGVGGGTQGVLLVMHNQCAGGKAMVHRSSSHDDALDRQTLV